MLSATNKELVEMAVDRTVKGKYQSVSEYNGSVLGKIKYSKPHNHFN